MGGGCAQQPHADLLGSLGDMIDVDASSETTVQAVVFTVMTEDDVAFESMSVLMLFYPTVLFFFF